MSSSALPARPGSPGPACSGPGLLGRFSRRGGLDGVQPVKALNMCVVPLSIMNGSDASGSDWCPRAPAPQSGGAACEAPQGRCGRRWLRSSRLFPCGPTDGDLALREPADRSTATSGPRFEFAGPTRQQEVPLGPGAAAELRAQGRRLSALGPAGARSNRARFRRMPPWRRGLAAARRLGGAKPRRAEGSRSDLAGLLAGRSNSRLFIR